MEEAALEELERFLCLLARGRKVRAGEVPAQASEVSQGHLYDALDGNMEP